MPNEGDAAGVHRLWDKYHAKWGGMQMAGMIFQTHSNITANFSQLCTPDYVIEYLPAKNYSI
jgi:hypothetical protein